MTATHDTAGELADALQALVDHEASIDGDACILRVVDPTRGLVWSGASGGLTRGGPPALPGSPFRIASVTKTYTAVVVQQLAVEGRLSLDQPMAALLPAKAQHLVGRLHVLDGQCADERITVRQLLTHASGLFDYASSAGFFTVLGADPGHVWDPVELLEGSIVWGTPAFPPGEGYGYHYSDTNYVVLGLIIEHLDGRPLHESYRARILDPLGLDGTYLEGYEPHRGGDIAHSSNGAVDVMAIHGSADWAGGGLVSTTAELAVFAQALVGGRLLPPAALDELLEWRFRTLDPAKHTPGYLGYGLGVDARESNGRLLRGHRGFWGVVMHIDPDDGLTITGTINQTTRRPCTLMHGVTALLPTRRSPA